MNLQVMDSIVRTPGSIDGRQRSHFAVYVWTGGSVEVPHTTVTRIVAYSPVSPYPSGKVEGSHTLTRPAAYHCKWKNRSSVE